MPDEAQIRIGMVNFINTAPLYDVWQRTVRRPEWRVTDAPPATLNRMLWKGELDLAFVSSHEYASHPEIYRILPGLSISATGPVGSVFLFAHVSPRDLDGRLVVLSAKSQTSASLVKIILEDFYGVHPQYETLDLSGFAKDDGKAAGVMAIGDEALRMAQSGVGVVRMDLAEEWYRQTGLPFVFALWVVRSAFCRAAPEDTAEIHAELLRCVAQGKDEMESICRRVAPRIPMAVDACRTYLQGIEYDLGKEKQAALELFFEYLLRRGDASVRALPVRFFGAAGGGD